MPKYHKDHIDKYFDYNIFVPKRILYLGSTSYLDNDEESGTDHEMCEYFIKGLTFLESIDPYKDIIIQMNNLGGSWYHGMAIFNAIRACQCRITMIAYGHCMSMGSIIFQAADKRIISEDCDLMIHDGFEDLRGTTKAVENWAKRSKSIRKRMYEIYYTRMKAKNKKITMEKIEQMCSHDTILSSVQAVKKGLADCLLESIEWEKIEEFENELE